MKNWYYCGNNSCGDGKARDAPNDWNHKEFLPFSSFLRFWRFKNMPFVDSHTKSEISEVEDILAVFNFTHFLSEGAKKSMLSFLLWTLVSCRSLTNEMNSYLRKLYAVCDRVDIMGHSFSFWRLSKCKPTILYHGRIRTDAGINSYLFITISRKFWGLLLL